jgi:hypothetical protein
MNDFRQDFREIMIKQQEVIGPTTWDGTIIEYCNEVLKILKLLC